MHESFIYQAYFEDLSICDALIASHEMHPFKVPGMTYHGDELEVDKKVKDSTESPVVGNVGDAYLFELQKVVDKYIEKFPQCNIYSKWGVLAPPQIQKYEPGGGFFVRHCERTGATPAAVSSRHLVFMTYLNDVTDGGETEFELQGLKVQPRKGLTLIWPADWTHTHRGIPSPTQEKYIVTGWFNYM